ncbi:hypothetical protein ONA91_32645 [Micromonospora sp. DR5-3]|uniref:hypothetical protein n=1 Tax=unclassified Micromonospora TaxID=2617518 RepID=UPI0011D8A141|nr:MULTISPECIES: hypothetical protein [unclassified Micromonospora]MCW3819201.1 hypothetical protein [Micromonospora sp. DR5-3]TYC20731.1 hypothetical protein FXF52_29670 [Micromonospora sp. MP36]
MSSPDQYTLPAQPVAPPVERPRALFDGTGGVIGLRAATTRLDGTSRLLDVWLYGDPPPSHADPSRWMLRPAPGAPRPMITAVTIVPAGTDADGTPVPSHFTLTLDGALPGRGVYQLRLDPAGLDVDPLRIHLPVRLRPECGDIADCVEAPPPRPALTPPDYDTLARDYPALRDMLIERLRFLDPAADLSAPDLVLTTLELFAHLGDLLHYRLDRVTTEGWLSTARRRASVLRHARAVDYPVYPAISARTTVQVVVRRRPGGDPAATVLPGDLATDAPSSATQISSAATCFTLDSAAPVTVLSSYAEVALYDWTEHDATLTVGATSAVLVRPPTASTAGDWLVPGALLAFEVVAVDDTTRQRDWATGTQETAADDWPRQPLASQPAQVVSVTAVTPFTDPLSPGLNLIRVFWGRHEALTMPVPCSIDTGADHQAGARVGVARLGLFPAHHGLVVDGPATLVPVDRLTGLPADPAVDEVADYMMVAAGPEAAPGLAHTPGGRPWQLDVTVTLPNGTRVHAERVTSMLRAAPAGFSVVVDPDDELPATLRFRTGALGLAPPAGSVVSARYQIGAGPAGNVAANVTHRLARSTTAAGVPCDWLDVCDADGVAVTARNLTPGSGGAHATPLDDVRRDAPQAYSAVPRRAVLTGDLPGFAVQVPGVRRASARRSWCGSWPVAVVAYEPPAPDPAESARVATQVQSALDAVRMAGTEVVSLVATPVGILIALTVCLYPGSDPGASRAAILAALRPGTAQAPGLFAPGTGRMGADVYLSAVVAAVAALPQVDAVAVTEARRLTDPAGTLQSVLPMGPTEVAVCDDNPDAPDRGRILLTLEGGR